ncbi:hypothetical protein DI392_00100 [Vibrio albus]|uniref:Uncharacterized protein n=1 Tax=Vibrio albus TaxID=2200953 RepID=A0A2U3BD58_9VIBR|nr:hypothetical protein [Vibrio albus]PWI34726.1 hypothetical protein DI392_00100 [Vibrio albus]
MAITFENNNAALDRLIDLNSKQKNHQYRTAIAILILVTAFFGLYYFRAKTELLYSLSILNLVIIFWIIYEQTKKITIQNLIHGYCSLGYISKEALQSSNEKNIEKTIDDLRSWSPKTKDSILINDINCKVKTLQQHLSDVKFKLYSGQLNSDHLLAISMVQSETIKKLSNHPLNKVKSQLLKTKNKLEYRKHKMSSDWEKAYANFSWWDKIKYAEGLDFSELDEHIQELERLYNKLLKKHASEFQKLESLKDIMITRSQYRVAQAYKLAQDHIKNLYNESMSIPKQSPMELLRITGFSSAIGISYSLGNDLSTTHYIYNALRDVNSNFEGLSDLEIWFETLWMSDESLLGLENLVKGAYFENLVANDTGGTLFDHFNHPDTDITINGIEYQIKATDSISYIDSVDASIPVISTSEITEYTDSIDSGYSNEELTDSVDNALDGFGFDASDVLSDGILAGLGGLGTFATIQGINHAAEKYEQGGDGFEAILEGLGVAVEGTLKTMVNTGELAYKVATSRPSRAIGRGILKVIDKIDKNTTYPDQR